MRSLVYGNSFLVLAALIILSARDCLGQKPPALSLPTVRVTVTVRDETGAEIPEATVKFKGALNLESRTGPYGSTTFALQSGAYKVTVARIGFRTAEIEHFVVDRQSDSDLNVTLRVAPTGGDNGAVADAAVPTVTFKVPDQLAEQSPWNCNTSRPDCGGARDFFRQLQLALKSDDRAKIASLTHYPLRARMNGKSIRILGRKDLLAHFDEVFDPGIRCSILQTHAKDVWGNW